MTIGTKSVLFGVHQFVWHPYTVARAWRRIYGRWPGWLGWICIVCHDLGYLGCADMDGKEGRMHPVRGAKLAGWLAYRIASVLNIFKRPCRRKCNAILHEAVAHGFTRYHSRELARLEGQDVSPLCQADKLSILFDPPGFYLFRARLSGEVEEYRLRAVAKGHIAASATQLDWLANYRHRVFAKFVLGN